MVTEYPDDVKRIKDAMDVHAVAGAFGYAVFSMQDGRPLTMDAYPSRKRARKAGEKRTQDMLLILEISPDGMPYNEAAAVLSYERKLNGMGYRTPDSLETEQNSGLLSMPRTKHDQRRMIRQLTGGKPLLPEGLPYGNLPSHFRRV